MNDDTVIENGGNLKLANGYVNNIEFQQRGNGCLHIQMQEDAEYGVNKTQIVLQPEEAIALQKFLNKRYKP